MRLVSLLLVAVVALSSLLVTFAPRNAGAQSADPVPPPEVCLDADGDYGDWDGPSPGPGHGTGDWDGPWHDLGPLDASFVGSAGTVIYQTVIVIENTGSAQTIMYVEINLADGLGVYQLQARLDPGEDIEIRLTDYLPSGASITHVVVWSDPAEDFCVSIRYEPFLLLLLDVIVELLYEDLAAGHIPLQLVARLSMFMELAEQHLHEGRFQQAIHLLRQFEKHMLLGINQGQIDPKLGQAYIDQVAHLIQQIHQAE